MKFLVHAHVYYKELWDELASCIANFLPDADVCITTPHADDELKQRVLKKVPAAHYKVVENRGYDIAPFLAVLSSVDLSHYEYVVKLHTKRNVWAWVNRTPVVAGQWRRRLLGFCSVRSRVETCVRRFESDSSIGMIAGHRYLIVNQAHDDDTVDTQRAAVRFLGERACAESALLFVAGSMFMVRSSILSQLPPLPAMKDFNLPEQGCHLGTMAHVFERVFGYAIGRAGMRITDWEDRYPKFVRGESLRDALFDAAQRLYRATLKPVIMAVHRGDTK